MKNNFDYAILRLSMLVVHRAQLENDIVKIDNAIRRIEESRAVLEAAGVKYVD